MSDQFATRPASAAKVAIVDGIGPGLGLAVADRFVHEGFHVVGFARSPEKLSEKADSAGVGLEKVDAGDTAAFAAAIHAVERDDGAVEVIIFNAMSFAYGEPGELDPEALAADFRVNVLAPYVIAQVARDVMRPRGVGQIILTGGGLALDPRGWPQGFSLSLGKAAARNLDYSPHDPLAQDGIKLTTMTIRGFIKEGTAFDPAWIADAYWSAYTAAPNDSPELAFDGS